MPCCAGSTPSATITLDRKIDAMITKGMPWPLLSTPYEAKFGHSGWADDRDAMLHGLLAEQRGGRPRSTDTQGRLSKRSSHGLTASPTCSPTSEGLATMPNKSARTQPIQDFEPTHVKRLTQPKYVWLRGPIAWWARTCHVSLVVRHRRSALRLRGTSTRLCDAGREARAQR